MEYGVVSKILLTVISALGTYAGFILSSRQANKVSAELLGKFEEAVENKQKHSATELFRLIHGLHMNYEDILALIKNDDCSKIIYALKKQPGFYGYENRIFIYKKLGAYKKIREFDYITMKVLMWTSLTMALYSIYRYSTANGAEFIEWFIAYIIFLVTFGFFKKEIRFNKMVGKLINTVNIDTASGQEDNKEI